MEPRWGTRRDLEEHFRWHGRDLHVDTIEAFEASSKQTIDEGTFFNYRDRWSGDWHLGYYDRLRGRFTAVTEDGEEIVTHFRCSEQYIRRLPENDYR
jgi:hypothetical protein